MAAANSGSVGRGKKFSVVAALMVASTLSFAGPPGHYRGPVHGGAHWVLPAIIGGAVVYSIMNQPRDTVVIQQPPPPVYTEQPYIIQQPQYEAQIVWDYSCNCYRKIFVQKQ